MTTVKLIEMTQRATQARAQRATTQRPSMLAAGLVPFGFALVAGASRGASLRDASFPGADARGAIAQQANSNAPTYGTTTTTILGDLLPVASVERKRVTNGGIPPRGTPV